MKIPLILFLIASIPAVANGRLHTKRFLEPTPKGHRAKSAKCGEECDYNKDCEEGGECSLCSRTDGPGSRSQCYPKCGEKCVDDSSCEHAGTCDKCTNNECKHCNYGETRTYMSSSFEKGPWWLGHKDGIEKVGGACTKGYTRTDAGTRVTAKSQDKVACGGFGFKRHDAPPSLWANPVDTKSCELTIPYCEHHTEASECQYVIMERCTDPFE